MEEDVFNEVAQFIISQRGKYKKPFSMETTMEKDLGISGDDAVEFLEAFSEKYNVDVSEFKFSEYFASEGTPDVYFSFFFRNSNRKSLTILHLVNAIETGVLS